MVSIFNSCSVRNFLQHTVLMRHAYHRNNYMNIQNFMNNVPLSYSMKVSSAQNTLYLFIIFK
jgi:hypothetical protein